MKTWLIALSVAVAGATLATSPLDAEAKRLGGGKSTGMQRAAPAHPADTGAAPKPAQPTNAAATPPTAAAAAAPAKRSWMGPIAGLAAGLGIAALLGHFGLGAGASNFLMLALMAVAAFFVVRWALRRFAGAARLQTAGAGGPDMAWAPSPAAAAPAAPLATAAAAPADGFDVPGFERVAKLLFIRMQAANDAAEIDDLRRFTTPELYASLKLDLQERGPAAQQTDVVQLDAALVDRAVENGQSIASVRFSGLIRERREAPAEPFDEVWHFVRPVDESREWAIAGITATA